MVVPSSQVELTEDDDGKVELGMTILAWPGPIARHVSPYYNPSLAQIMSPTLHTPLPTTGQNR